MTTVVFLHAFGGSSKSWSLVAPKVEAPLLTPDLRGFGGTEAPPGDYGVESYADDVLDLVRGLEEFVLVGHSMGGKFALAAAMRRPRGLRGLVLVAPSPPTPEPMAAEERRRLLKGYGDLRVATSTVRNIVCRPISSEVRMSAVQDYLRASERAWSAWLQLGSLEDIADGMAQIDVPSRIVVGEEDPVVGPEVQRREVASRLSRCTVEIVPGAGHLLPLEAPDPVAHAIAETVRRASNEPEDP